MRHVVPRATFGVNVVGAMPVAPDVAGARQALEAQLVEVAQHIQNVWVASAKRLGAWNTGAYIRGITSEGRVSITMRSSGPMQLEGVVEVVNTARHARFVEDGHSAYHLPSVIDWGRSQRVKVSKSGRRYLHIPFRHFAHASESKAKDDGLTRATLRQMMPSEVYAKAKRLKMTRRLKVGAQYDAQGRYQARDRYKWGGRLHVGQRYNAGIVHDRTGKAFESRRGSRTVPNVNGKAATNPQWKTPKHEGMFKAERGPEGNAGRYFTIRTLTEDSPGWNIPAQAGKGIARAVSNFFNSTQGQEQLQARMAAAIVRNA